MTIPSKEDIKKREIKYKSFLKHLDEEGRMEESKLCTQLRSAIRSTWMKHPTKLAYLYSKSYPDMNNSTRTKWLVDCELCCKPFKLTDVQVDHIKGEHSLKTLKDLEPFSNSILNVSFKDIRILCIPCHEVCTYSERYKVSFEEAVLEKDVITKITQPVAKQKKELIFAGYSASEVSNEEKRRNCYRELLKKEELC